MTIRLAHIISCTAYIGLFVGAILSIQHAVAVSQASIIIAELEHYRKAPAIFKEKYRALPGDHPNASSLWNTQNGDGDDKIGVSANPKTHAEVMLFWQHLALAGLIDGTYSGATGPGESGYHAIIGENVPASRIANAGWSLHPDIGEAKNNSSRFDGYYGSYLFFGRQTDHAVTYGDILSAKTMANIDKKIDDGMPATGFLVAARPALSPKCADGNDHHATYRNSLELDACHMVIKNIATY